MDFDTLKQSGFKYGFKEFGYFSQAEWLNSMGLDHLLRNMRKDGLEKSRVINLISGLNDISGLETISGVYLNHVKLSIMNNGKNKLAIVPDKQF